MLRWPIGVVPELLLALRSFHNDWQYRPTYLAPFHALHFYDYPCEYWLGEDRYSITPGQYSLTPAGVAARYHLEKPGYHWCVHFHLPRGYEDSDALEMTQIPVVGSMPHSLMLVPHRMAQIALWHHDPQPHTQQRAQLALQELLLGLIPDQVKPTSASPFATQDSPAVYRAATMILTHLDEPIQVPKLAREVGMSQNHLARSFKSQYGKTMQQYQAELRMARADLLLRTTDQSIKAVAAQVGYHDPQHFNKTFRKHFGTSPSARRQG